MNSLGTSAAARGGSGSARAAAQAGSEESYPREEPVCFHLICNLPFPCEHKLEMERGDGRSTDARLSLSLETAPSAEERSLLGAHGWQRKGPSWMPSSAQVLHYLVLVMFSPVTVTSLTSVHRRARRVADLPPCLAMPSPKPNPSPPKEQSKQTWGHKERSWSPQTDSHFCQRGSAKDGFPGKIKPNHGLQSRLPANISMPHLLL